MCHLGVREGRISYLLFQLIDPPTPLLHSSTQEWMRQMRHPRSPRRKSCVADNPCKICGPSSYSLSS